MAKKKAKKKSKSAISNRKKSNRKKASAAKRTAPKKRVARKLSKKKSVANRTSAKKPPQSVAKQFTKRVSAMERLLREPRRSAEISGEESGDLQGLSRVEEADSESVDELLEEGNSFEAGIVSGVEEADDAGVREVHTREVPEDDVPEEYLDND